MTDFALGECQGCGRAVMALGVQAQGQQPLDQLGISAKRLKRIRRRAAVFAKTYDLRAGGALERLLDREGFTVVDLLNSGQLRLPQVRHRPPDSHPRARLTEARNAGRTAGSRTERLPGGKQKPARFQRVPVVGAPGIEPGTSRV